MKVKIDALIQTIRPLIDVARDQSGGMLTEQMVRDQVSIFEPIPPFMEVFKIYGKEVIVKELLQIYTTWVGEARSLEDKNHKAWLPNTRSTISWNYWNRYEEYLRRKRWPEEVTKELNRSTDQTLGLLEDPSRISESDSWDRRGLVVGHVQSGKTANYTGVLCKSIDAGYKVIIVLAGLHDNLRSQTQIRLDEELLGYDSTKSFDPNARTPIGVGLNPNKPSYMIDSVTNRLPKGDFSKPKAKAFNIHLHTTMNPLLFVVKKNAGVLKNLVEWLDSISTHSDKDGNKYISGIPLLVIDDEADHGSVDTKKNPEIEMDPDHDPTTLNRRIRELLKYFSQSAYIGYTATPYANLYIHKSAETNKYGEDLFPRSFITNLSAPTNYFGPVRVFGLPSNEDNEQKYVKGLPLIRTEDVDIDAYQWLSFPHKTTAVPRYEDEEKVPPSLRKAIRSFVLLTAARRARKHYNQHNSMLVHVTRWNAVQEYVHNQVHDELEYIVDHIKRDTDTYKNQLRNDLKLLWEEDFIPTTKAIVNIDCPDCQVMMWQEIESHLLHTIQSITVKSINGTTGDILDYENSKDSGLNVIAIGGDKLSRGLTLEGLSISYFTRSSAAPMYDTLMQMGRWFGYRSGYHDLCRLFTTKTIAKAFQDITTATEELRKEFDHMTAIGATPSDYGLKVLSHPTMLVTSKLKMQHGSRMLISFSNYLAETRLLSFDENIITNNFSVAEKLFSRAAYDQKIDSKKYRHLLTKIKSQDILDFLDSYKEHPNDSVDTIKLAEYIVKQNSKENLTEWTLYIPAGKGEPYPFSNTNIKLNQRQWRQELYDIKNPNENRQERINADTFNLKHLISEDHEFKDIAPEIITRLKEEHKAEKENGSKLSLASLVRKERGPKKGLIILYPIDPAYIEDKNVSKPLIGFAISFPQIDNDEKVEYIINSVYEG